MKFRTYQQAWTYIFWDTGQVLPSRIGGLPVLEYKAGGHLLPHPVPGCLVKPDTESLALRKKCAHFPVVRNSHAIFAVLRTPQISALFPRDKLS
jgi:hypothetical protein